MTESSPDRQDALARASHPPGTVVRQRPPVAIRWAAGFMFAGAALVAAEIAGQIALMNTVKFSGNGGNFFPDMGLVFVGIPVAAVECALWVWMGSMALAGRGWARIVSSVFFGVMCLLLIDYIRGFLSPEGVASTGPFIGTMPLFIALPLIGGALEWLVGLAAIILVWQRAAGQFYGRRHRIRDSALLVVPIYGQISAGDKGIAPRTDVLRCRAALGSHKHRLDLPQHDLIALKRLPHYPAHSAKSVSVSWIGSQGGKRRRQWLARRLAAKHSLQEPPPQSNRGIGGVVPRFRQYRSSVCARGCHHVRRGIGH